MRGEELTQNVKKTALADVWMANNGSLDAISYPLSFPAIFQMVLKKWTTIKNGAIVGNSEYGFLLTCICFWRSCTEAFTWSNTSPSIFSSSLKSMYASTFATFYWKQQKWIYELEVPFILSYNFENISYTSGLLISPRYLDNHRVVLEPAGLVKTCRFDLELTSPTRLCCRRQSAEIRLCNFQVAYAVQS